MPTPETRYARGPVFPKDALCQGKCQGLVPEEETKGRCLALDLARKNRRRASRNSGGMRSELYRMTINYGRIATEVWGCKIISLEKNQG